ncbi:hypothetical protein MLD38_016482 [Melastoma candidum]|uniref:Uncharacterized protein n=1 Tax=Melastoma candidum TaxID=119954 RepID=A0ACB9QMQ4_9MYRT|nr:hypothetical protein MLD38_016482 [Melastoma candidum]
MGFSHSKFRRQEPPLSIPPSHQLLQPPPLTPSPPPAPSTPPPPPPPRSAAVPPSSRPPPPPLPPPPGACPYYQCSPYPHQPHPPPHPHYSLYYNAGPRNYGYGYSYGGYNQWPGGPGTSGTRPVFLPPRPAPVPIVEQKQAKKVKNEVNVHKDSIRVTVNENGMDSSHLVSFTFDALVDGSFTIFYFAKEGANCTFSPVYPEIHTPRRFPFLKGAGQRFYQPSETGIDLGFFDIEELAKPTSNEEITQAVLERDNNGHFQVRVVKQILWNEGVRYELREIYGISSSSGNAEEAGFEDNDPGKECVICMTEPKDTAVLPCRHMCMCSECAKELKLQSNKCPICRQPIQELIEIKVK